MELSAVVFVVVLLVGGIAVLASARGRTAEERGVAERFVDPLAEAEIYLAYGRAELARRVLVRALEREPNRNDVRERLAALAAK